MGASARELAFKGIKSIALARATVRLPPKLSPHSSSTFKRRLEKVRAGVSRLNSISNGTGSTSIPEHGTRQALALQVSHCEPRLLPARTEQRRRSTRLLKAHKARGGDRAKKLFQFLNDDWCAGARQALGPRAGDGARSSADKREYEAKIARRFGFAQQLRIAHPVAGRRDGERPPTEAASPGYRRRHV